MEENLEENVVPDEIQTIEAPSDEVINGSILLSIKKMLGPSYDEESFDTDIIIHINSCFTTLRQLGIGPAIGYRITNKDDKWVDFIKDEEMLDSVKTYIYIKTKLVFDPPINSALLSSFEKQASELEWRLNVSIESDPKGGE